MCIARKFESSRIFDVINEIDPNAFVSQSRVVGVFGNGFSTIGKKKLPIKNKKGPNSKKKASKA